MILTLDLGTTATKAVVWGADGPLAVGRAGLTTSHPQPGWAEQDPDDWWRSVVSACAEARAAVGSPVWNGIDGLALSAARETFVPVDASGRPLSPGLLWSDRRAAGEATARAEAAGGVEALTQATGVVVDPGTTAAKADWLAAHQPDVWRQARWLLAPRDLVVWRLTGTPVTDTTLASRTGWYTIAGQPLADAPVELLPPVRTPTEVVGPVLAAPAAELMLPPTVEVVLGAGDRACEVLGTGAGPAVPMVSWGTTANVSLAVTSPPDPIPAGVSLSAGALGGWLLECGLSAAGAALDWLARLTGQPAASLLNTAAASPPGARGVTATSWLNGARAPWWNPDGRGAFVGLTTAHEPGDLARALVEAVAFDVARSLEALGLSACAKVGAAGAGAGGRLWSELLAAVSGATVERRNSELAASAGALLLGAAALGRPVELEAVNPVVDRVAPDPGLHEAYRRRRAAADRVALGVLALGSQ